MNASLLAQRIGEGTAPTELLTIQQLGGTLKTVERGEALAQKMLSALPDIKRQRCPVSALTIGLECGGSDATSGMAA